MLVLCQLVAMNTQREAGKHRKWSQLLHSQAPWRSIHFSSGRNRSSSPPIAILVVNHSDDLTSLLAVCLIICSLSIYFSLLSSPTFLSCLCSGSLFFCLYLSPFFFFLDLQSNSRRKRGSDWVHQVAVHHVHDASIMQNPSIELSQSPQTTARHPLPQQGIHFQVHQLQPWSQDHTEQSMDLHVQKGTLRVAGSMQDLSGTNTNLSCTQRANQNKCSY